MRFFDRAATLLLCLCLLLAAIITPALLLARSPIYYRTQFAITGIYATENAEGDRVPTAIRYIGGNPRQTAYFTDAQLDEIAAHIIDFLFGDTEDFALTMDGVFLNDEPEDGVAIFGEEAIVHMEDVRGLMQIAGLAAQVAIVLLPFLLLYLFLRRRECGRAFCRWVLLFFSLLLFLIGGFCLVTYLTAENLPFAYAAWRNIHHLFFPFQPEKVAGSFFNDALTCILTLELFLTAVFIVLGILLLSLILLTRFAVRMRRDGWDF